MEPGFKSGPQTPLHTTLQVTVPFALALTPAISLSQWNPPGPRGWGVLCPWHLHCFPHLFPSAQQQKATEGGLLCHQVAFGSHLISFCWTFTMYPSPVGAIWNSTVGHSGCGHLFVTLRTSIYFSQNPPQPTYKIP